MILHFEKTDGKWYLKHDEWKGDKADLQMVAGADFLLEAIKHRPNEVCISVLTEKTYSPILMDSLRLTHAMALDAQGNYIVPLVEWKFWLCPVAKWVFGYMPTDLYFRVVE
jgi:hypothetical protein